MGTGNRNARGITVDPDHPLDSLVVNDGNQDTVYRYEPATSTTADRLSAAALHPLTTANNSPNGIAVVVGGGSSAADFDRDGNVDGADFPSWQRGFGSPMASKSTGDANGDGAVNAVDIAEWEAAFGQLEGVSASKASWSALGGTAMMAPGQSEPTTANSLGAAFDRDWLEWRWPAASHDDRVEVNDEHQLSSIGIARLADPLADAPVAKVSKHERLVAPAVDTTHARQGESPAPWLLDELLEQVCEDSLP